MIYKKNKLIFDNFDIRYLGKKFKTPIYCYSLKTIKNNILNLKKNFKKIKPLFCYAVKANANLAILKELKNNDLGADVVSQGELMKALKAGINPKKIVFSGVGKTAEEIDYAIKKNILLINAESHNEVLVIEKIAKKRKKLVNIGLRLNPDTDAKTLKQISTGKSENKFGVDKNTFLKIINSLNGSNYINIKCLSVHIGSQIMNNKPYEEMLNVVDKLLKTINYKFEYIDLGGGMGIKYDNERKNLDYKKYITLSEIIYFSKKETLRLMLRNPVRLCLSEMQPLAAYIQQTILQLVWG